MKSMKRWMVAMPALLLAAQGTSYAGGRGAAKPARTASSDKHKVVKADAESEVCPEASDALQLSGTQPFAVNVRVDSNGVAEFSAPGSSTSYTQLAWTATSGQSSLQIAFAFAQGAKQITNLSAVTSGLTFGSVTSGSQTGTVSASNGKFRGCYHFDVDTTVGSFDPIVIVTVPP